jgi:hypothetical protein
MHRLRMAAAAAITCCAVTLIGAGTASAQDAVPLAKKVAVTGTNKGKDFKGTYTINRFTTSAGKLYAVGTLKGTLRNRSVTRRGVRIPATATRPAQGAQVLPPLEGGCQVLNLVLRPITLNLLGLVVRTNLINVRIDALPSTQPGGGLLGDLLCGITNLLNPTSTPLGQLAQALNAILALAPRTA